MGAQNMDIALERILARVNSRDLQQRLNRRRVVFFDVATMRLSDVDDRSRVVARWSSKRDGQSVCECLKYFASRVVVWTNDAEKHSTGRAPTYYIYDEVVKVVRTAYWERNGELQRICKWADNELQTITWPKGRKHARVCCVPCDESTWRAKIVRWNKRLDRMIESALRLDTQLQNPTT